MRGSALIPLSPMHTRMNHTPVAAASHRCAADTVRRAINPLAVLYCIAPSSSISLRSNQPTHLGCCLRSSADAAVCLVRSQSYDIARKEGALAVRLTRNYAWESGSVECPCLWALGIAITLAFVIRSIGYSGVRALGRRNASSLRVSHFGVDQGA